MAMKHPTRWAEVTVFQWQQLSALYTSMQDDLITPTISILTGLTETEVDSLPLKKRSDLLQQFKFVHTDPEAIPVKVIKVNGKRYRCLFDIRQLPGARYIESKHFSSDPNGNLHKIAASMVMPMKKTWLGWKDDVYNAAKHAQYADDMLQAPITAVLGSVVFFCEVYLSSIKNFRTSLISQMTRVMTIQEANETLQALEKLLDGIIQLRLSPNTSASR